MLADVHGELKRVGTTPFPHQTGWYLAAVADLTLGISPCPNDTFVFHDVVHRDDAVHAGFNLKFADIADLNQYALDGALDVVKISAALYPDVAHEYALLRAGGAMGYGVGPLLVTNREDLNLEGATVAIPGETTTAALLFRAFSEGAATPIFVRYDNIMSTVASGEVDAGVIIHESRFTYQEHNLKLAVDLGSWWEHRHKLAIPLGVVAAKRSLGRDAHKALSTSIRASVQAAQRSPASSASWVAQHAQELSEAVRQRHIDLYVNAFSEDIGVAGEAALKALWEHGRPDATAWRELPLFLNPR